MNRASFLRSQPFLFPLESIPWPPPLAADSLERSNCRRETLLRNFALSIEPVQVLWPSEEGVRLSQQSTISSQGPAFFVRSKEDAKNITGNSGVNQDQDSFDPAMCCLELSVQSVTVTIPPRGAPGDVTSFSSRLASPTAYQKLMRRQQQSGDSQKRSKQVRESTIFLEIERNVYQMDLTQVENVQLEEITEVDRTIPSSLLIQFGTVCIFRIFSLTGDRIESLSALKDVQRLFVQILTEEDQISADFPSHYYLAPLGSPAGSSTTVFSSSQELGQRDFSRPIIPTTETPTGDSTSTSTDLKTITSSNKFDPEHAENDVRHMSSVDREKVNGDKQTTTSPNAGSPYLLDVFSTFRKRQSAYLQSKSDLESLEDILMQPAVMGERSTDNKAAKRLRTLEDQVIQIMTSVPQQLAASYCTQTQLQQMIQHQMERIHRYEVELDGLVQSFWPVPARNGGSSNGLSRQTSLDRRPQISADECIGRAKILVEKHKEVTAEKLALIVLPTRGF